MFFQLFSPSNLAKPFVFNFFSENDWKNIVFFKSGVRKPLFLQWFSPPTFQKQLFLQFFRPRNLAKPLVFDVVPIEAPQNHIFLCHPYRNTAEPMVFDVTSIETTQNHSSLSPQWKHSRINGFWCRPYGNIEAHGFWCHPYRNTTEQCVFDVTHIETQQNQWCLMSSI